MEALVRDCIPFVYIDCNINIIKKSHPDIYKFIIDNNLLVKNGLDIYNKINNLNYIKLKKQGDIIVLNKKK